MNRTDLINYLIKTQGYKTYLEIGVGMGRNFNYVNCEKKVGVDPDSRANPTHRMTSDQYFASVIQTTNTLCGQFYGYSTGNQYDCIFIDGLHHAEQVRRDIENAWVLLRDKGCLVIHDTNPEREDMTHVPRDAKEWTGDVYKAVQQIGEPPKFTLKDDYGVTVVRKTDKLQLSNGVIEWECFELFREVILKLYDWDGCKKIIDSWI